MDLQSYFRNIVKDVKVVTAEEFDRNFERKAFFDKAWPQRKNTAAKGSLLLVKGGSGLRGSILPKIEGNRIVWRSSLPYATIHNEGGEITVTTQMIKFFWAMFYKATGAVSTGAGAGATARNTRLNNEAAVWKALALMKVGSKIKMPQRQYIGSHPVIDREVEKVVDAEVARLGEDLYNKLKRELG